jgi:hypothetical protein
MTISPHFGLIGGAPSDASADTLSLLEGYNRGHTKNPAVPGAADIWAIGCADTADGPVEFPVSWTDIANDEIWAKEMLDLAGVGGGDFAFFSYIYSRSAHTWPWLKMGFERGAKLATGMPTQWDAYRLEMYCRLFAVKLVFGLTPEALDGLEGAGHKLDVMFGKVDRLIAVGDAWRRLRQADLQPWKLYWLWPSSAIDPWEGGGARFDCTQWAIEEQGGQLSISNKLPRATSFKNSPLASSGRVEKVGGEPRLFMEG